jgi:hypothetical protein
VSVNQQQESLMAQMRQRALDHRITATETEVPTPQAITISCKDNLLVSDQGGNELVTLCDPIGNGTALFRGSFFKSDNSAFTAITPLGGYLYAMDWAGTLTLFTDKLGRGVADQQPLQFPGLYSTEHLIPVCCSSTYAEDSNHGRLFQYQLGNGAAASQVNGLPTLGGQIHSTQMGPNKVIYTIDSNLDAVVARKLSDNSVVTTLYGSRISAMAVDELGTIFALGSGNCHDEQLPSVNPDGTTGSTQPCSPTSIGVLAQSGSGYNLQGILPHPLLDVFYSFQNSMYAQNGKLYVITVVQGQDSNWKQQIIQYSYTVGKDNSIKVSPPTVFAAPDMFSQYAFLSSLTSFNGGNVTNPIQ